MADVTVEFGAKDLGLAKTLATVQEELVSLRTKVKSGDLSISDLEQTMRRVGQVESMEKRIKGMGQAADSATADFKQLDAAIDSVQAEQASTGFGSVAGQIGKMTASLTAAYAAVQGFREAFLFVGDAIKLASDLGETTTKVGVIFGNNAQEIQSWARTTSTSFGQTTQQAMDAAATFAIFGKAAGLSGGELVGFSKNLVGLSADFASFYNTSPEEAITAIGAALRGESEPIRKFGVLLDDATLKAEAMKLGLYDGTGALDAQTKSLAAYNAILSQSTDAQGDFERTSDGLANQTRILSAEFTNLKTALGEGLITPTGTVISSLNEGFIPAMKGAIQYSKELFSVLSATPAKGQSVVYDAVAESLNGFNYYMAQAFNNFTPFGYALTALANKGKNVAQTQTEANAAINKTSEGASTASAELTKTGLAAAEAAGEFKGAGEKADTAGQRMAESFSLGADFKPQLTGIADGWSDVSNEIAGSKPLLESNFSLTDSITGKVEEQTQGIGKLNEQLEKSKELEELIKNIKTVRAEKEKEAAAKQAERQADLRENLELDLEILKAQISGNEQEEKAVNFKKEYNAFLKQAIDAGMGKPEAEAFADQIARARQEQAGMNKELTQSAKLMKDIADAQSKDSVDKGGKLQEKAQGQIQKGDFSGARTTAGRLAANEVEASIRGTGKGKDTRSIADIGKDFGVRQQLGESGSDFKTRVRDVREGAATVDKFGNSKKISESATKVDRPGQDGAKPPEKKSEKSGAATLDTLVGKIKDLLEKIEPRLPVAALTA
jgi:HAMP domain-containing protein